MLPLYLSIEGLYSYQQKQEIDFSQLTEAGLFGIFGNVGSGKSSVLEAISYALYGETERLNKQEKRAYNMLNLRSDQAVIDFQFLNFENRKFRFIVQWKRRKRFEETTSIERTAYEWKDNSWIPLESSDGEEVTKLSYPNFRRTIIIPQGQFKEFLELKGKDRSDMMKEIFALNQYDLGPKVSVLQIENNRKLENLKGVLSGFEEVTEENKIVKEEELKLAQEELKTCKAEYTEWANTLKNLSLAKENRQALLEKEKEMSSFHEKLPQVRQQEKELIEFESVSLHFTEHINNLALITKTKETLLEKIGQQKENKEQLSSKIDATQTQLTAIQSDYDKLDIYKRQNAEYEILIRNVELEQSKNEVLARIEKGTPIVEKTKLEEKALIDQLHLVEEEVDGLKGKRINTSDMLAIESWYRRLDELAREQGNLERQKLSLSQEINSLQQKFESREMTISNWKEKLEMDFGSLKNEQQQLQERESAARLKQELSHYILNLHDGEPCPLCGSEEHPNIMHTADLSTENQEIAHEKSLLAEKENLLRALQSELITASQYLLDKMADKVKQDEEIDRIKVEQAEHDLLFRWETFDKSNRDKFENQKNFIKELEESISNKELKLKELRSNIQITKDNFEKYKKSIDELYNKAQTIEANMAQNQSLIRELTHLNNAQLTKLELTMQASQLDAKIKSIEANYREWNLLLQETKNQFATLLGQHNEAKEQYKLYNTQLLAIQSTINDLLKQFNFEDITLVKSILNKTIDPTSLKEKIQHFHMQMNAISEHINILKERTKDDGFSDDNFEYANTRFQELSISLEQQLSNTGALEKELQRLKNELDKKSSLLQDYTFLSMRKDNLKTLENMFKGNGFVNYVSSIHLERLCEIANHRFHRLTKNQLSLCINESNEFEVKDYLNNGYQRSVKTLSGGQSFQASLCLALALAENVQALNKADRNFFFIDEGFGTQDNESINTVFDTLQYLHQENRVVGIISHVEELKEKMPRSITITKDIEKGSQVNYN